MLGILIEAGMTCPSCEGFIPLNALVETIRCSACGTDHELGLPTWKTLLDDILVEVPFLEEGEGSSSTIFGNYNYRLTYGRLLPRYDGTKDDIPPDDILGAITTGAVTQDGGAESTSVRSLPVFCADEFKGIIALVGEDTSLLPGSDQDEEIELPDGSAPIAFQCPNCGGSLLVDGTTRSETCRFCDTKVSIPDQLWQILHPAKMTKRWHLLLDPSQRPLSWESDVLGAAACPEGDLFLVLENDNGDYPVLARSKRDGSPVWTRFDLDIESRTEGSNPGPTITPDGRILLVSANEKDLLVLSPDGLQVSLLEGTEVQPDSDQEINEEFTMKGCGDMVSMPDGSLILFVDRDRRDHSGYFYEFLRYDLEGNLLTLWPETDVSQDHEDRDKPGFFKRLFGWSRKLQVIPDTPYIEGLENRPEKTRESDIMLASGSDSSLYMFNHPWLIAFDPSGRKKYCVEIPCSTTWGRPVADKSGNVFIIAQTEDDEHLILKVSADGSRIDSCSASVEDGNDQSDADVLVLSTDGTLHALGYDGCWMRIMPEQAFRSLE